MTGRLASGAATLRLTIGHSVAGSRVHASSCLLCAVCCVLCMLALALALGGGCCCGAHPLKYHNVNRYFLASS
jgi:hypothetical protein